nr:MAG TPA: hypothetical protein [Crassvirales sp.]
MGEILLLLFIELLTTRRKQILTTRKQTRFDNK